jgi:hypothetical protein
VAGKVDKITYGKKAPAGRALNQLVLKMAIVPVNTLSAFFFHPKTKISGPLERLPGNHFYCHLLAIIICSRHPLGSYFQQ